jgi:hypothetical protein
LLYIVSSVHLWYIGYVKEVVVYSIKDV